MISKRRLRVAWTISGLVILFMLFDSISKFFKPASVVKGTLSLGFSEHHIFVIGILGLLSAILYMIPRFSVLGAILLTGYFGGAIATHVRLDNPLFTHTLFPVYIAVLAWAGIWLRNEDLRKLFPLKKKEQTIGQKKLDQANIS
ncbi:DoxX family protein [Pseudalkalibacillus salsuginis]|uniref:DoxX family protein n=1 Tax=Pseudalkalibacillus salsuginis TaxID=2910972 RepID=UPI001F18A031|nr:DoxX family protein [Pseudalkalibacillus salsuginis]MCF6409464.1 DoxX family protein [Pseudalkalibacillus salsuginis]